MWIIEYLVYYGITCHDNCMLLLVQNSYFAEDFDLLLSLIHWQYSTIRASSGF